MRPCLAAHPFNTLQGLFAKRRQLILTDAPRLLYVDPDSMEQKGEIPWQVPRSTVVLTVAETMSLLSAAPSPVPSLLMSFTPCSHRSKELMPQYKNMKTFFVHTVR